LTDQPRRRVRLFDRQVHACRHTGVKITMQSGERQLAPLVDRAVDEGDKVEVADTGM
jgi:hypothetical protein